MNAALSTGSVTINGGAGDDRITGGSGTNILTGEDGDVFVIAHTSFAEPGLANQLSDDLNFDGNISAAEICPSTIMLSVEVSIVAFELRSTPPVARICVTDVMSAKERFKTQQFPSASTAVRDGERS